MIVYLGKERKHAIVKELPAGIENVGHKLFMDIFFSSSDLYDDLHTKNMHFCGTVR
jgi:hypothetical protein